MRKMTTTKRIAACILGAIIMLQNGAEPVCAQVANGRIVESRYEVVSESVKAKKTAIKDVTKTLKQKSQVKKLAEDMAYEAYFNWATNVPLDKLNVKQTINVKLNANNKAELALCLAENKYIKNEKYVQKNNKFYFIVDMKKFKKYYKNLFGEEFKISKVNYKGENFYKKNNQLYFLVGEIGDVFLHESISEITEENGTYTMKIRLQLSSSENNSKRDFADVKVAMKKCKASEYGYKVTKFSYTIK